MSMGIGYNLPRHLLIKRRFRWTFEVKRANSSASNSNTGHSQVNDVEIMPVWCKIAMRPNITFEELELGFLNERAYLSGKPQWEPITITILDCCYGNGSSSGATQAAAADNIRTWAQRVYIYGTPETSGEMSSGGEYYKTDATLRMYDGIGTELETWTLYGAWPQQINWGDLDYTNNDSADIELTLRFDNADQVLTGQGSGKGETSQNSDWGPKGDSSSNTSGTPTVA